MPEDFIIVGQMELSPDDLAATSDFSTGWQSVPIQAQLQWRWDHDREALLKDEDRRAADLAESQRQRAAVRSEFMRTLTLDSLVDRTWFASWDDGDSNLPLHKCRSLMTELVNELRAAPKLTLGVVKKHLKQSVMDFNRLNEEHHFISTIQREDLCEAYEQIACAAKSHSDRSDRAMAGLVSVKEWPKSGKGPHPAIPSHDLLKRTVLSTNPRARAQSRSDGARARNRNQSW